MVLINLWTPFDTNWHENYVLALIRESNKNIFWIWYVPIIAAPATLTNSSQFYSKHPIYQQKITKTIEIFEDFSDYKMRQAFNFSMTEWKLVRVVTRAPAAIFAPFMNSCSIHSFLAFFAQSNFQEDTIVELSGFFTISFGLLVSWLV